MNELSAKDRQAFAAFLEYGLENAPPLVKEWLPNDILRSNLAKELEQYSKKLLQDQIESQKEFKDSDYRIHVIDIDDIELLVATRFLGIEKPYIEVLWQDRIISDNETVKNILSHSKDLFHHIKPELIHIFEPTQIELDHPQKSEDGHFMAAPLRLIKEKAIDTQIAKVKLVQSTNLDFLPHYDDAYKQVHQSRPWLMDVNHQENHKKLQTDLENGLLFEIFVDDKWAGIMAAQRTIRFGLKGYAVREFILTEKFRGLGLGGPLQKILAENLPDDGYDCLLGTIGAQNSVAIKAAETFGRVKLGTFYWLPL